MKSISLFFALLFALPTLGQREVPMYKSPPSGRFIPSIQSVTPAPIAKKSRLFGRIVQSVNSYTVQDTSIVSYNVVDASGTTVRILGSGIRKLPGTYIVPAWFRDDDAGNPVNGPPYSINGTNAKFKYTWIGTLGNDSENSTGATKFRHWKPITHMLPYGQFVYWAHGYNEGGLDAGAAKFAKNAIRSNIRFPFLGSNGIVRMATDGQRVYWANSATIPTKPITIRNFIFATNISNDALYTFSKGVPTTTSTTFPSTIYSNANGTGFITGLSVQKTGNLLVYSRSGQGQINFHNKLTADTTSVSKVLMTTPNDVVFEGEQELWVRSGTNTVAKYAVNQTAGLIDPNAPVLTLSGLVNPLAMDVSPDSSTIAVVDGGTSQQVKFFSTSTGQQIDILGQAGGYATNATVTDDKFCFNSDARQEFQYSFISYDADGTFWLGDTQNRRSLHIAANRRTIIERKSTLPVPYVVTVDLNDPTRVFQGYLEFKVNYDILKNTRSTQGSWELVKNWGVFGGGIAYEEMFSVATLSNGRTYGIFRAPNSNGEIWELVAGGAPRKTNISGLTVAARFDKAGNLYWLTKSGTNNVRQSWTRRSLTGFDANNNPTYSAAFVHQWVEPANGQNPYAGGAQFSPATITSGGRFVSFDGDAMHGQKYYLGILRAGTNTWQTKTARATYNGFDGPGYFGGFPNDGSYDIGNGMGPNDPTTTGDDRGYAGSVAITAGDDQFFYGYHGEFWRNSQTHFWNHYSEEGTFLGQFGSQRPSGVLSPYGFGGNTLWAQAVRVAGVTYIFCGEENDHSGIHVWMIEGSYTKWSLPVNDLTPTSLPPKPGIRILAGLPNRTYGLVNLNSNGTMISLPDTTIFKDSSPSRFWYAKTNHTTFKPWRPDDQQNQDVYFYHRHSAADGDYTRAILLQNSATLASWTLQGFATFSQGNSPQRGGHFFDVIDDTGKKIATFQRNALADSGSPIGQEIRFNNNIVVTYSSTDAVQHSARYFRIIYTGTSLIFRWGMQDAFTGAWTTFWENTVTTPIESGANMARPYAIQYRARTLLQGGTAFGSDRQANLVEPIFIPNSAN